MSPIDDELRAALHGRARVLDPSTDPLAGIERRAKRMQRNRLGAAVAGSALAVAAVAGIVPALQSTTTAPVRVPVASAEPTLEPTLEPTPEPTRAPVAVSYALDPEAPWAPRGEPIDEGTRVTIQNEYADKLQNSGEVLVTPLYASTYEPSGLQEVVFLARVDGEYRWGISASTEAGPEFLWDEPLRAPALALAARLPGDEVDRLVVLAAPETEIEYQADGNGWVTVGDAQGIGTGPVEGQAAGAVYRVLDPEGSTVTEAPVPSVPTSNGDPFAFDTDDPWPYRGMEEPSDPNIGVEANRLFVEADPSRGDGSWGERGLYAGDSDAGMSFLITLWTKRGEDAVVTTTWQRGDRAPEQSEQRIEPGQRIIQSLVPTDLDDGSVLLVALASPQADIGLEQPELGLRMDGIGDPGVGLWILDRGKRDGMIRLLDGAAEVYAEPVDVGPDAYS